MIKKKRMTKGEAHRLSEESLIDQLLTNPADVAGWHERLAQRFRTIVLADDLEVATSEVLGILGR